MSDENEGDVDLWGDPWTPPKDRRGRKRHRWMKQIAENIAVLKASGLTVEVIASRIGLSEPTLRKYYFRELEEGADLAQAVLNEAMWRKAIAGNVSAARYIREEFGKGPAKAAANRVRQREEKAPALGVKAERQAAAERVGGIFATPAPPKLQ
ncbi:hypothetical protein [Brevundimonas naejangsanensis]|uniref:hypothetical protein n=1 Tax=Brevundimonas naejangsanensis TaxID=588932 RepID=UPI00106BBE8A|nr:hypothetical protein [Brevundimonas naejangsanensis]QBQ49081.1 hypothetical protein E3U41_10535 [Brevundimonas naejangsanensis]